MTLWRIHLGSKASAARFCVERGVVGIGFALDEGESAESRDEFLEKARITWAKHSGFSKASNALFNLQRGDLVWTRDPTPTYHLGRVDSDWRYKGLDRAFRSADIVNVRDCGWVPIGAMDEVPGKVLASFRARATIQPVRDDMAECYSEYLFARKTGQRCDAIAPPRFDILSLLSDEDIEDVVGLYLQVIERCVLLPSTCKRDTPAIEGVLRRLADGERVGFQVKSGNQELVCNSEFDGFMYFFAASGQYRGPVVQRSEVLVPDRLLTFLNDHPELMSGRVQGFRMWIEHAVANSSAVSVLPDSSR